MKISRELYILFVGWMVLLTILSLIPRAGLDLGRWDKVAHFIAYFFGIKEMAYSYFLKRNLRTNLLVI